MALDGPNAMMPPESHRTLTRPWPRGWLLVAFLNVLLAAWLSGYPPLDPHPDRRVVRPNDPDGICQVMGGILFNNNDAVTRTDLRVYGVLLGVRPGHTVADVGACTGIHAFHFASLVGPRGKVWATDINEQSVAYVRHRAEALGVRNIEARVSTPVDACLPPASVDRVLLANVYHCIVTRQTMDDDGANRLLVQPFLRSIRRGMVVDGRLLITDGIEFRHAIARECARAGFVAVDYQENRAERGYVTLWTPAPVTSATRTGTR